MSLNHVVYFSVLLLFFYMVTGQTTTAERSFTLDPNSRSFLKDGEPFRYVSGSFHYFRTLKEKWRDIMVKMRGAGLNVLQTYVEWNSHETEPGVYNFEGNLDLVTFIKTAQDVGLLVVLRPGPYICAEREMGGFPYWLMREKPNIDLRSTDPVYMKYVQNWFSVLLPMMEPLLYNNGGPIILVQVENEYGQAFKCDRDYMAELRDLNWKYLGKKVILFRTDVPVPAVYQCDSVEGVFVTADFNTMTKVEAAFDVMNKVNPTQPNVVTEFYPGWLDNWGKPHAHVETADIVKSLDDILLLNGSVNFYMMFGGTNFAFSNGANMPYSPQPTSYDYAAPITEAGDVTDAFFAIREVVQKYLPVPPMPSPDPSPKMALGPLKLYFKKSLLDAIPAVSSRQPIASKYPLTFEAVSLDRGLLAYSTVLKNQKRVPVVLKAAGLHDRGYVFVNNDLRGVLSRMENIYEIPLIVVKGDTLTIVVENQGRVNYGVQNRDFKGLTSNVILGKEILVDWTMTPIPLNDTQAIHDLIIDNAYSGFQPAFYSTTFTLPEKTPPADTYLDPSGWYHGVAFLNGFNLGRYWPIMGPQVTLYVPKELLKPFPQKNILTLLELEGTPCTGDKTVPCTINLLDHPKLDGPVPE